jgi:hypothetical protein
MTLSLGGQGGKTTNSDQWGKSKSTLFYLPGCITFPWVMDGIYHLCEEKRHYAETCS